jgi:hypothetical protein
MPRWRVDYLGSKGKHLGTVEAPYEKSAIEQAMETFNITPARLFKIVVTKIEPDKKPPTTSAAGHEGWYCSSKRHSAAGGRGSQAVCGWWRSGSAWSDTRCLSTREPRIQALFRSPD